MRTRQRLRSALRSDSKSSPSRRPQFEPLERRDLLAVVVPESVIGGPLNDAGHSVAVDAAGNYVLTGQKYPQAVAVRAWRTFVLNVPRIVPKRHGNPIGLYTSMKARTL
jgi:hypothetical protein